MRTTLLAAPLLFLAGCASVEKMGEDFQWLFADTYQVQVSGTEKFDKEGVFLRFSYEGQTLRPGEGMDRDTVQSILEGTGFGFVPTQAQAKSIVDVHWIAAGPRYETKTRQVERPGNCFSGGKTCPNEVVKELEYYVTCTYSLDMAALPANGTAVNGGNSLRLHTQWEVMKKDEYHLFSGKPLALVLLDSALNPLGRCIDAEKRLGRHLQALAYLLNQQPDAPQGNIELQERKGRYRIKPPMKQEEAQH